MGWAIGYDSTWQRDIGYGVPATCDYPGCGAQITRGLAYVCADEQPYGGDNGCGLFFCSTHLGGGQCERCAHGQPPCDPTPDVREWIEHQLTHGSWQQWREMEPDKVKAMKETLAGMISLDTQVASM